MPSLFYRQICRAGSEKFYLKNLKKPREFQIIKRAMKIGIAQINTTAGDFEGNSRKILDAAKKLKSLGADFAVFPELALCGSLPKDKTKSEKFLAENAERLEALAREIALPAFVGFAGRSGGALGAFNCAALIENQKAGHVYSKCLLPNYGIFDEPRNFDAGSATGVVEFKGVKIGITICEDIWSADPQTAPRYANSFRPLDALKGANCDVVINMASSLWSAENEAARFELLKSAAKHVNAPVVLCNLVGCNDEFVCAGKSAVVSKEGEYCGVLKAFEEDFAVFDLENLRPCKVEKFDRIAEMYEALKMSLGDFVHKSGFKKVALGLSGGIDSALVAALAADALGAENVIGISLPSKFSSSHSIKDAQDLAKNLGLIYGNISIEKIVAETENALAKIFAGLPRDVTEENVQSRARGLIMMAISNKLGAMVLATGNKSECAVGYCTLYGDTCGGFAPIADVYKTDVFRLARYINRFGEKIPENTIIKPPSAELRPGQKDSDSLPEYDILDAILHAYIEENLPVEKIAERGFDKSVVVDVVRKFERCEYKRRQLPPAPRLTASSFGAGRRVALTDRKSYEFR